MRDYHAAIGVTHEDYGGRLRRDHTLRNGDVVIERDRRILDDADPVPMLLLKTPTNRNRPRAHREAEGIELRNCPAYIREWITKERESS